MTVHKGEDGVFNIGLVMAGAVTAGAFTGGVMDYLLESLELWHQEYRKNPTTTPKPNVRIEALTGASAGSIASAVTLLSLATRRFQTMQPGENTYGADKSLQFYTWVNFGMQEGQTILEQIFDTDDLHPGAGVHSILNTQFIDNLITQLDTLIQGADIQDLPEYINPKLDILMTLSNLRGVPLHMYFSEEDEQAAHTMSYHKAFAYFQYHKTDASPSTLPLDLKDAESRKLFLDCARASGAFPIGLKSIPFRNIPKSYIEANLKQIFGDHVFLQPDITDPYEFIAVDGGMTNNEPMAEALRLLGDKLEKDAPIILIDPFPNYIAEGMEKEAYDTQKNGVLDILPQLYETLRNQTLFKEKDVTELFGEKNNSKMIWPTRYNDKGEPHKNPIATGALGGFAGFFHRSFRYHDYMLGVKNCESFLRYHFSQVLEDKEGRKLLDWPQEAVDRFAFKGRNGEILVPIIPDYRIQGKETGHRRPFLPRVWQHKDFPAYPQVDYEELIQRQLKPRLKKRLNAVVQAFMQQENTSHASARHRHPFRPEQPEGFSWANLVPTSLRDWFIRRQVCKAIVPRLLDSIIYELHAHDLFKDNPQPPDTILKSKEEVEVENIAVSRRMVKKRKGLS